MAECAKFDIDWQYNIYVFILIGIPMVDIS